MKYFAPFLSVAPVLALCAQAQAGMVSLDDEDLSSVRGQAMFEIVNTTFTQEPQHFVADWKNDGISYDNKWRELVKDKTTYHSYIDPATGRTFEENFKIDGWPVYKDPTTGQEVQVTGPINFTKLRIGADIDVDMDVGKMWLGGYTDNGIRKKRDDSAPGGYVNETYQSVSDYDIKQDNIKWTGWRDPDLFGNQTGAYHPFHLGKPYIEIAHKDNANGEKEILGFRVGFEEMDGVFGVNFKIGSGRGFVTSQVKTPILNGFPPGGIATITSNNYGRRAEGDAVLAHLPGLLDTTSNPLLGLDPIVISPDKGLMFTDALCVGRTAGLGRCAPADQQNMYRPGTTDHSGIPNLLPGLGGPNQIGAFDLLAGSKNYPQYDTATRDFWVSFSKVDNLLYPATNPNENFPAQHGAWLNLTDNVRIMSVVNLPGIWAIANTGSANLRKW